MEALEAAMMKHNIHLEHSSNSSLGMALSACGCQASRSGYALNVSSSSHSHEWLIDSGASYHMAKNKAMFSSLNDFNTKNIYVGDDRSLSVVETRTFHIENGQFNDVLCVPTLSSNLLFVYQINHSGEGKIVEFSPHDVVIKELKDPRQILSIGIANDSTRLYKFHNFGSSNLPLVFVSHNDEVSKLWHERFRHLKYRSLQNLCKENMVTGLPMLRSDNGGEYVKKDFINFCTENGIQMQHTVPYTPQQNGVAERKNRTLKEMANYDESEDDNPPPPSEDPPPAPSLAQWVQATWNAAGDLVGDPTDQRRTRSQFERACSLLAQVSENYDPHTFAEASGHPHWDVAMNEEYRSLLENYTWDLVPLPKGRKLVR
eukprot:PITA_27812